MSCKQTGKTIHRFKSNENGLALPLQLYKSFLCVGGGTLMALQDIVEAGLGQAEVLLGLLSIGWCAVHRGILELVPNTFHHLPVVLGGLLVANNTLGVVLADDAVTSFLNLTRGSPGLEDVVLWHIGQLRYIMPYVISGGLNSAAKLNRADTHRAVKALFKGGGAHPHPVASRHGPVGINEVLIEHLQAILP